MRVRPVHSAAAGTRLLPLGLISLALLPCMRAQLAQQGPKLVGAAAVGSAFQGYSVALSADGNTALVGGWRDNGWAGAAWVWTRNNNVWQQGPKLVGSGAIGPAHQGYSVALSGDGNTALVGGNNDNSGAGAVWVWTRGANNVWQQGAKLTSADAAGTAFQGESVALSSDGNTALVGGLGDTGGAGAVWVWIRNAGVWTQQGTKLVGSGAVGNAQQGRSVALSANGNVAVVGGNNDNFGTGAVWVWTRSGSVWTQQGPKLVGSGAVGNAQQGYSVALSADGYTALAGGFADNGGVGAVWVWSRSSGVWVQQGSKLAGTGASGNANQGVSAAISADGNIALAGGWLDNPNAGAVWTWTRNGAVWTQQGQKLVGAGATGSALQGWAVALSYDGRTALSGGPDDNFSTGATWVFVLPTNVSSQVTVTQSDLSSGRNRGNSNWTIILTVTNSSPPVDRNSRGATIAGSLHVALTNLPPNVTMLNNTGTYNGSPYITVSPGPLAWGASVSVTLEFANPGGVPITYTPVTYVF